MSVLHAAHHCNRYWACPSFTNTSAQNRLVPILRYIYRDGLGPLSNKIDRLEARRKRQSSKKQEEDLNWWASYYPPCARECITFNVIDSLILIRRFWDVNTTPLADSSGHASQAAQANVAGTCAERELDLTVSEQGFPPRSTCRPPSSLRSLSEHNREIPEDEGVRNQRPSTVGVGLQKRRGELTAAGILWDRTSKDQTPKLRQCLTYAEISRNRTDEICRLFGLPEDEIMEKCLPKMSTSGGAEDKLSSK